MDVGDLLEDKQICICAGSGGVGKTTTSAAIAMGMAAQGLKVAVLTIDPAKRLANSLGLQCVAEGIEHAQQAAQLRAAGCGFGQGFYFAKPLGADEAIAVVEAQMSGAVPRTAVAG